MGSNKSAVTYEDQNAALLHYEAAISLIDWSHLAKLKQTNVPIHFEAVPKHIFDAFWDEQDPKYGRLVCWITFSVGAEYLAKAACLNNGVLRPKPDKVPIAAPTGPIDHWAKAVCDGTASKGQARKNYGQLGDLCGKYSDPVSSNAALYRLAVKAQLDKKQTNRMIAAYRLLGDAIRNRDLHTYQHGVRDKDFDLAAVAFIPAFNIVLDLYFKPVTAQTS